jgi:multicomponent Na+:H+ antiporter subunit G
MSDLISYSLLISGIALWFLGSFPLLGKRSIFDKLHFLSISDTLGSLLIVLSLLMKIPREWPILILAMISLTIWNSILGYVMAYCTFKDSE